MLGVKKILMAGIVFAVFLVSSCGVKPTPAIPPQAKPDLSGIQTYLLGKVEQLKEASSAQREAAATYYGLAEANQFDYAALWQAKPDEVTQAVQQARAAWLLASPLYEQIEGIVAGVPQLSEYDLILDAGGSGEGDTESAVPFDITLPDGRVLPKPGNLFGVLETSLWGTNPAYIVPALTPDLNQNGKLDFGESLPDANVLKGTADLFDKYVLDLSAAAKAWQPSTSDAFTALVIMVPTMNEYFDSWKNSRFVAGANSTQMDFAVISRLSDIQDILSSLEVVYAGVKPLVASVDEGQASQIEQDLRQLKAFVSDIFKQEQNGRQFSAEEADQLGAEAQNLATTITGQIAQIAATLGINIED